MDNSSSSYAFANQIIDTTRISWLQLKVFLVCFLMNALDGMDVLVISYAAPMLAQQWSISPTALGTVFSGGLLGMAIGAMLIAPLADRIGRRKMILISVILTGSAVSLTALAPGLNTLIFLRFVSGLGIGSMLASVATMAAEFAPDRRRNLILGAVLAGYPIGATLFGLIAADVIPAYGWRSIFMIAGVTTLATLPLVWILLPESLSFLLRVQPFNALTQVNKILRRMDVTPFETLPDIPDEHHQAPSVKNLFHRDRATATTFLWLAFFMNFVALYFLTSWIPKLASAAGLALNLSIYAGAVFNLGAVFGIATSGLISQQLGLKKTIAMFLFLAALSMACFQFSVGSSWVLPVFGLIGFFIQGGFVGLYAVATRLYPTDLRTTGVGWAIGAGRSGAIVGPFLGGIVIAAGVEIGTNFSLFGFVLVLAALCTLRIRSANID